MSRTSRSVLPLVIGSLAVVLFDAGCARDTAGPTSPDTPVLARGGKPGGGGGAKDIDPTVDTVNRFLGGNLDTRAMLEVVDPSLYRQRKA